MNSRQGGDDGGALSIDVQQGALITNSSFVGNTAIQFADHVFNRDPSFVINAQNNYWSAPPQVPADVSEGVDMSLPLASDPTANYAIGDYYNLTSPFDLGSSP